MPTTYAEFYLYILEQTQSDSLPSKEFLETIYNGTNSSDQLIRWLCYFTARNVNYYLFPKDVV
jgi:hypothetical protein